MVKVSKSGGPAGSKFLSLCCAGSFREVCMHTLNFPNDFLWGTATAGYGEW
jgi:hypothetical protein